MSRLNQKKEWKSTLRCLFGTIHHKGKYLGFDEYGRTLDESKPIMFKIINSVNKQYTYCGVLEFSTKDGEMIIPEWMRKMLNVKISSLVDIYISKKQEYIEKVKFLCFDSSFLKSFGNAKELMLDKLKNFTCLTQGDQYTFWFEEKQYVFDVRTKNGNEESGIVDVEKIEIEFSLSITSPNTNRAKFLDKKVFPPSFEEISNEELEKEVLIGDEQFEYINEVDSLAKDLENELNFLDKEGTVKKNRQVLESENDEKKLEQLTMQFEEYVPPVETKNKENSDYLDFFNSINEYCPHLRKSKNFFVKKMLVESFNIGFYEKFNVFYRNLYIDMYDMNILANKREFRKKKLVLNKLSGANVFVQLQTKEIIKNKKFFVKKKEVVINSTEEFGRNNCQVYMEEFSDYFSRPPQKFCETEVYCCTDDYFKVFVKMKESGASPVVVMSKHPYKLGGNHLGGYIGTEESLCRRSNYLQILEKTKDHNDIGGVIMKNVEIFREDESLAYKLLDNSEKINLIGVPELQLNKSHLLPNLKRNSNYIAIGIQKKIKRKINTMFDIAIQNKFDTLIITDWGVEKSKGNPKKIVSLFLEQIRESVGYFKTIVFAIYEKNFRMNTVPAYMETFGNEKSPLNFIQK